MPRRDWVDETTEARSGQLIVPLTIVLLVTAAWWLLLGSAAHAESAVDATMSRSDGGNALLTAAFRSPVLTLLLCLCAMVESYLIWKCIQTLAASRLGTAMEIVELERMLQSRRYTEAVAFCERNARYYTRLVGAALSSCHRGKESMEFAVDTEQEAEERRGMDRIHALGTLAGVALLTGLLGLCVNALDALAHAQANRTGFLELASAAFFPPTFAALIAIPAFLMEATYRRKLPQIHARVRHEAGRLIAQIE